jgi:hypothetical protein
MGEINVGASRQHRFTGIKAAGSSLRSSTCLDGVHRNPPTSPDAGYNEAEAPREQRGNRGTRIATSDAYLDLFDRRIETMEFDEPTFRQRLEINLQSQPDVFLETTEDLSQS